MAYVHISIYVRPEDKEVLDQVDEVAEKFHGGKRSPAIFHLLRTYFEKAGELQEVEGPIVQTVGGSKRG